MRLLHSAVASLTLCSTVALAQLRPEIQTGSLIPVKPVSVEPVRAGEIRKAFARCVYKQNSRLADRLLENSDPVSINYSAFGVTVKSFSAQFGMADCLSGEAAQGDLGLRMQPNYIRSLLVEEAYLARVKRPTQPLETNHNAVGRTFVSVGEDLAKARGYAALSDCVVQKSPVLADNLLRTMPGSGTEALAARALAPSLGACLMQGQNLRFTPNLIRAFVADGAWQFLARTAAATPAAVRH